MSAFGKHSGVGVSTSVVPVPATSCSRPSRFSVRGSSQAACGTCRTSCGSKVVAPGPRNHPASASRSKPEITLSIAVRPTGKPKRPPALAGAPCPCSAYAVPGALVSDTAPTTMAVTAYPLRSLSDRNSQRAGRQRCRSFRCRRALSDPSNSRE